MKIKKYLNSLEAANLLGVNVSTIKRWTNSGKLGCIQTAGGHRKFLMKHINDFLANQPSQSDNISVLPYDTSERRQINHLIQKQNIVKLERILLKEALSSNRENVNMIVTGLALAQYPIYKIFDDLLTPVLHKIGDKWEDESISVVDEHIASQLLRDAILLLRELIIAPSDKRLKVLCLTFDDDLHDIAIKMAQIVLEQRGFNVFYSGQGTPVEGMEQLVKKIKPERIYISCTYFDDVWGERIIHQKNRDLHKIYNLADESEIEVYVGGQAFDNLTFDHSSVISRLKNFSETFKY